MRSGSQRIPNGAVHHAPSVLILLVEAGDSTAAGLPGVQLADVPSHRLLDEERRKGQRTPAGRLHTRTVWPAHAKHRGGPTMDSRQFDRWTRLFDGVSRRDAITLLATGIGGGLLANGGRGVLAQVSGEKCKDKGDNCKNTNDCCNNLRCKNGTCKKDNNNNNNDCKGKGKNCKKTNDCCNNLRCKNGTCKKDNNNNNNCKKKGDNCKKNSDCCNNLKCNNNNTCK